jgi:hypothetical protein
MKNQIKPIIAALLLGTAFFVNANTLPVNPSIKPFVSSMYKSAGMPAYNLAINKAKGTKMKVVLKNSEGEIVYKESLSKRETKFRTKLNLSELQKGSYTLELNDGKNVEIKKIEI